MAMISRLLMLSLFIMLISLARRKGMVKGVDEDAKALCSVNLAQFLPPPYGGLENMICQPVWNSYLLRYSQTKDNVVTIVLSTVYTTGWVGMGFSRDGKMINSSCMVGWVNPEGQGKIRQYYVEGLTPSKIKPEKGELPLTSVPPLVYLQGATIYLAFQLKYPNRLKNQPILLAFATKYPHHHHLTVHDDKTTILFDFSSGNSFDVSAGSNDYTSSRKTHGVLGILGWGLFCPFGAIFARYLKNQKSWYYFHVSAQFIGFILGFAGVVLGLQLHNKLQVHIPAHEGIGILVLVLSILQVLAFFLRPDRDSKYRKCWNLYHGWVGRIALFFAAINIVLGMHYAGAGEGWKIGYGFLLGTIMLVCIVLETLLRLKKLDDPTHLPTYPMNSI
ncbi:cytochrome b561 and DOMON domain-containing protein At3g61750 [Solanum pennellii]|uniref:Cytochrome b561 and DOMON domain-containing protein At3g61750 n=1 Tax=Solanum pennellii TaxID=28526 RepID=A0ABM1FD22_SOLPN|nr:cytochrome b561 and DOMON domain-containing protein At3g61750 [Solanum pennellii]XP_015055177.1 cytochrome b561 and DOMON domain-containing protein At3g61750 [Solanum pennellii]XP_015055178.1 cytochrome b561 and DOMON domain-containing protein At3g61750 [Solanum pennellii]